MTGGGGASGPGSDRGPDAGTFVGLLADETRLRVLSAIALGARTVDAIGDATALDGKSVHKALERLVASGIVVVDGDAGGFRVAVERFRAAARRAAEQRPPTPGPEVLGATPEQADVLRNFLADDRLTHLPAARTKRLVVLDFLAGRFEPGKVYPEPDVNDELGKWHSDYAALRRALVDEGFLERRDNFYWRSGGTVAVD
ncbi:MAG: DUF2087 domain-containing protein [Actinobacteria bacterium]|nr:DUF2087 domain-containing protein [Actinomycetota bacterium]